MEKILIVTNYYPPEKGAAANRIEQLALKLKENNFNVSILCPLANYPKGEIFSKYKNKFNVVEKINDITVNRLWIYPSISKSIFVRIFSVCSFSMGLFLYLLFKKTPNKIIIQSPPLLVAFISILALKFKNKKTILNVSDLWPLAAIELNAIKKDSISHKISLFLEKFIYKNASVIICQSNEIIEHINKFIPQKSTHLYRNLPDHKNTTLQLKQLNNEPIKIFYAGLLGMAQGILSLCKNIKLTDLNIELHIFGDGAEKKEIENLISKSKSTKIKFHGMVDRHELHNKLKNYDIALVPLITRIYGSVPSKIFEYSALGYPILYFGGGEGEMLVAEHDLGWVVPVEDYDKLNLELVKISKLNNNDINELKEKTLNISNQVFNLNTQISYLIKKGVF